MIGVHQDPENAIEQIKIPQSRNPLTSSQMRQRCSPAVPNVEVGIAIAGLNYKRSNEGHTTAEKVDSLRN